MTRSLCPRAPLRLLDVASGKAPLHQAVLIEKATNLSILPSPLAKNTAAVNEFAFSRALGAIFEALRRRFDIIVVDFPPLMSFLADGEGHRRARREQHRDRGPVGSYSSRCPCSRA